MADKKKGKRNSRIEREQGVPENVIVREDAGEDKRWFVVVIPSVESVMQTGYGYYDAKPKIHVDGDNVHIQGNSVEEPELILNIRDCVSIYVATQKYLESEVGKLPPENTETSDDGEEDDD